MDRPLFSTYATDENRVSGTLMAVFERLSLGTLQLLLGGATAEEVSILEFRTQPTNPVGPGTPDGAILASVLYLFEFKIRPDTVEPLQLQRHRAWLDSSAAEHRRLYVVTPDHAPPEAVDGFAEDERIVWLSYAHLDDAIAAVLEQPVDQVAERERFLLRELASMLRLENLVSGFDTLIVAGRVSWPEYQRFGLYACQAERAFRDVPYFGFYADKEIKPVLARRLAWWPSVPFDQGNAARLQDSPDPLEQRLGRAIPEILASTDRKPRTEFGVVMLSGPDDPTTLKIEPVPNRGRGAWTQGQRYTSSELLQRGPADTDQLHSWELERGLR